MDNIQKIIEEMAASVPAGIDQRSSRDRLTLQWISRLEALQGKVVAWAELGEDQIGVPKIIALHFDKENIRGEHRRLPLCAAPPQADGVMPGVSHMWDCNNVTVDGSALVDSVGGDNLIHAAAEVKP